MPTRRLGGDATPAAYVPIPTLAAAALDSAGAVQACFRKHKPSGCAWSCCSYRLHDTPTLVECLAKHS